MLVDIRFWLGVVYKNIFSEFQIFFNVLGMFSSHGRAWGEFLGKSTLTTQENMWFGYCRVCFIEKNDFIISSIYQIGVNNLWIFSKLVSDDYSGFKWQIISIKNSIFCCYSLAYHLFQQKKIL